MRKTIVLLLAVTTQAIGTASAQQSLRPGTPHMFSWSPEQQAEWYPAIETVYRSATIKRGDYVHPLSKADRMLTVSYRGKGGDYWRLDDHMKAYDVSGLMVDPDLGRTVPSGRSATGRSLLVVLAGDSFFLCSLLFLYYFLPCQIILIIIFYLRII